MANAAVPGTSLIAHVPVLVLAAMGCATRPAPPEPPDWPTSHAAWVGMQPEPARLALANPAEVRYHMRMHFQDLRTVEQLLVAGRLQEGLAMAHLLTRRTTDPGMARWDEPARRVTEAARALVKSTSVDDALRGVARVAVQCAACHVAARSLPTFAPAPLPPPDRPTREVRMARHAWAADRLWEGIIGADDARWTSGLTVLAAEPLPPAVLADRSQFAKRLQARAREALEAGAIVQLEARGIAYGEMLTLCAGCHSSQRSSL